MTGAGLDHLSALYAETHDPWGFAHSTYEQDKFRATRKALARTRYRSAFELGCGNGALAAHLADLCSRYTGLDAVGKALAAARKAVPSARFIKGYYPCPLPVEEYDLLILSEILYFLDRDGIRLIASDIATRWPRAEVICVTYLGPTGHAVQGDEAVSMFIAALGTHDFRRLVDTGRYRIDRGLPGARG